MSAPTEGATDEDRRDFIVTVARELAEAEGWTGVSTRRLAERAEVDVGDLYQHFADQEALLAAVAVCAFADLAADLAEAHAEATESPEATESAQAPESAQATGSAQATESPQATGGAEATEGTATTEGAGRAWPAVVNAYLDFAYANPEVYDAMLALTPDLALGVDGVPAAPRAVFAELRAALTPLAGGRDPDVMAEVGWSLLHGVVMLTRGGRLRPEAQEERETMIADRLLRWP
ncbi:WHG domain-containing protein [Micromonospora sp. NPDC005413]|uniref:WHG domain-containing protein n=1 Tax=Micromonospora sp. NPDC005413 TaxID=3154563 RepID=UPI0033AD9375